MPLWPPAAAGPRRVGRASRVSGPGYLHVMEQPTVWCASRSSIVEERFRWCGNSWNTPAAVWPISISRDAGGKWLSCFPAIVVSSLPPIVGCADTHLMAHLTRLGWHWRLRIKGSFLALSSWSASLQGESDPCICWSGALLASRLPEAAAYGPVHLALGRPKTARNIGL